MKKIFIFLFFWASQSFSQNSVSLIPIQDNTLYESAVGDLSNGSGSYLFIGKTNNLQLRRALILFDISQVPSGAIITSVALSGLVDKTLSGRRPATIHEVLESWGEGAALAGGNEGTGITPSGGDATWIHRFNDTVNWSSPGGSFGQAIDTAQLGLSSFSFSSQGLVNLVQDWVSGTKANHGFLIVGDESANPTAMRINSRENTSSPPTLIIGYDLASGNEPIQDQLFSIFPNPVENQFSIAGSEKAISVVLYDLEGRILKEFDPNQAVFRTSDILPGIYILNVLGRKSVTIRKLVFK